MSTGVDPQAPADVQAAVREMLAAAQAHRARKGSVARRYRALAGRGDAPPAPRLTALAIGVGRAMRAFRKELRNG